MLELAVELHVRCSLLSTIEWLTSRLPVIVVKLEIHATCDFVAHCSVHGGALLADAQPGAEERDAEVVQHMVLNLHDLLHFHAPVDQEAARSQVHRPECTATPA